MEIAGGEPALQDLARRGADHATKLTREVCPRIENPAAIGRVPATDVPRASSPAPHCSRSQRTYGRRGTPTDVVKRCSLNRDAFRQADACGEHLQRDGASAPASRLRHIPRHALRSGTHSMNASTIAEQ